MKKLPENLKKIALPDYKTLPQNSGIYIFLKVETPIYIGKAINLKSRVSSYFDLKLESKTARMVSESTDIAYIQVTSELEALLLEAKLIRSYNPHYNIQAKDDKHPLYIIITKETFPRVLTARKVDLNKGSTLAEYGPFPSSTNVRTVLRMIRRIFPYSDHKLGKRGCLYSHIGLCSPCPSVIATTTSKTKMLKLKRAYLKNIRHIKAVLDGNIGNVKKNLEKDMTVFSRGEMFEEASYVRDQISRLEYIIQPRIPSDEFIKNPNLYQDVRKGELADLANILSRQGIAVKNLVRIECFDIAHLAGVNPTASMVTFVNAEPDKKYYRHFRIRQTKGNSDVDSMREVIKRRLKHFGAWGKPDLIIVDGGKPQISIFLRELENFNIPVVGIAKRFETLVFPNIIDGTVSFNEYRLTRGGALNLVQRIRNEAHRFARRYHHKLISRDLVGK